ncbi:hypothetical protein CGBL_0111190 [Corynebacterium glutamicum]|nr:hypothetical protein CGBL_0111190 [Corynebacterium glutamicum]
MSFGQKVEDAGDDAMTDDFELRPEWLESVQKELVAEFGNGGDGVVRILTEI